jgi:transcriptional regulator with XRE-family HTH domain
MVDEISAGERVARYRARMTQDKLAEASGLSAWAVRSIERGARPGRLSTLNRLARALGVTTSDLLAPAPGAPAIRPRPDALLEIRRSLTPPVEAAPAFAHDATLEAGESSDTGGGAQAWADVLAAVPTLLDEARALHETDPAQELAEMSDELQQVVGRWRQHGEAAADQEAKEEEGSTRRRRIFAFINAFPLPGEAF